ncbi:MAG TPA: TVP38/TMEM64 family protein [Vicinamibacteria bacterium]|nr:TVP38/TMEM64 family protein [Vicinamibacteria bacterium]
MSAEAAGPPSRARWLVLAVVVALLVVGARVLPVGDWLREFQSWVARQGALGGVAYAAVYVLAALAFVPGSVLTVGAGLLFGLVWGTAIVSVASTTAAALAFLIARYLARERVEALARRNRSFGAIDRAVREKGWRIVALLRLSPLVPFSIGNYLYGLTPVAFWPYVLASWIAMLPATVLYVYLGAAGKAAAGGGRSALEWVLLGAGLAATAVVTVMVTRAARRQLARMDLEAGPESAR